MEKRFIGVKELSEYLGIAVDTIYSWVSERRIPFHKFGKLVKFDQRQIDSWADGFMIEPNKEVAL